MRREGRNERGIMRDGQWWEYRFTCELGEMEGEKHVNNWRGKGMKDIYILIWLIEFAESPLATTSGTIEWGQGSHTIGRFVSIRWKIKDQLGVVFSQWFSRFVSGHSVRFQGELVVIFNKTVRLIFDLWGWSLIFNLWSFFSARIFGSGTRWLCQFHSSEWPITNYYCTAAMISEWER